MSGRKMHQTTVRFGPDLWDEIAVEAERAGVSVAQYVRDAALMRVSYTRGRDGDPHYQAALELVSAAYSDNDVFRESTAARHRSREVLEEALALISENRQAVRHGQELREDSRRRRRRDDDESPAVPDAQERSADRG
jgi:hypothetical protein